MSSSSMAVAVEVADGAGEGGEDGEPEFEEGPSSGCRRQSNWKEG